MNRHVSAIAGRLSLRPPQRRSLEILDHITEIVPPSKDTDVESALAAIQSEFPTVTDFEREFPSATNHNHSKGGKLWKYVLILHDAITENMTLAGLVSQFTTGP